MKKTTTLLAGLLLLGTAAYAQEEPVLTPEEQMNRRLENLEVQVGKMSALKISGYIQTQWKWDELGIPDGSQNSFSVRRGRIKTAYSNSFGEAVFQIDITENGVGVKDAYLKLKEPRAGWISLTAGVFNRPFGSEIAYSSSQRESPERSRVILTLFPKERDLGAALGLKGPANTVLQNFGFEGGLFTGNGGTAKETDSRKDFIGHLFYGKAFDNVKLGLGTSLYSGGVKLAGNEGQKAYELSDGTFKEDAGLVPGKYAKRRYYGFDGQLSFTTCLGLTSLRGEYLWGIQPGAKNGSSSPTGAVTSDIYLRDFSGYYAMLAQNIGNTKQTVVLKYDSYDPNRKLSKGDCLTDGDVAYSTLGFGWLYRANANLRLMAYYEVNYNEKVDNGLVSSKFASNIKDNVFTLRVQYKF